jgi:hypothetical protein
MGWESQKQTPRNRRLIRGGRAGRTGTRRRIRAVAAAMLCCGCAEFLLTSPGAAGGVSATVTRALVVKDSAHLERKATSSDEILEEGPASGTLPGKVRAYLNVGATVIAHFTIQTSAGSISGVGSGTLKGRPEEPSFSGRMTVSQGTGRYKRAHGEGGFYGAINRSTFRAVVQTSGTLSY